MGLDCSHDAFHGAYSAFNRLRQAVARAMGGSFPPHNDPQLDPQLWYWGTGYSEETHPGLAVFLEHSDCDGQIDPAECVLVADDLERLLPQLQEMGEGHIAAQGGYRKVAAKFIAGCRAAAASEPLRFE